ncbi:MAG TPA: hypothetical protein PLF40_30455, partial [Kofleriaceae bacterium]|nr:hypothetical protein [Kofleriaceae bacterium]
MSSDRAPAENRLEHFNADRSRLLSDVERRVVQRLSVAANAAGPGSSSSLEYVINDVCYNEIR